MSDLWTLSLSSFEGIVGGATHWYARLHGPLRVEVTRVIGDEQAAEWNLDERDGFEWTGEMCSSRFNTEEEARSAAVVAWRALSIEGDALVEGETSVIDPRPVLAGPRDFVVIGNQIVAVCEKVGWWDGPLDEVISIEVDGYPGPVADTRGHAMTALGNHWDHVLKTYDLSRARPGLGSEERIVEVRREPDGWSLVRTWT